MRKKWIAFTLILVSQAGFSQELSRYSAARVQKAYQLAQKEQLTQAIHQLEQIETSRAYDQAVVARMLGIFYWQKGNNKLAIQYLDKAVSSKLLAEKQDRESERMLADLYFNQGQSKAALKHYYALQKNTPSGEQNNEIWLRIAKAHYQLTQWSKVIAAAEHYLTPQPISKSEQKTALALKLAAQLELNRWQGAIKTLRGLIALEPNKVDWWRKLASVQLQIGQDSAALDTLSLAKLNQLKLNQRDRRVLAQLYAQKGVPERAALEISQLDNAHSDSLLLSEQARYWQQAKEWHKAAQVWKLAAEQEAKYHWQLAQIMLLQGNYLSALNALNQVEGRDEEVALAKTRAYYQLNQFDKALAAAKKAKVIHSSKQANNWVEYLTSVTERRL